MREQQDSILQQGCNRSLTLVFTIMPCYNERPLLSGQTHILVRRSTSQPIPKLPRAKTRVSDLTRAT